MCLEHVSVQRDHLQVMLISKLLRRVTVDWSVYTCQTQLYDGRDMYIIYYIKNNYMFRPFSLAIFRLINKKLSKH